MSIVLEMLRDPFWQFVVLAFLALAAIVVSILGLNRPRKRLSYRTVIQQRLLGIQADSEGRVEISFEGEPVHNVWFLVLHLRNSGNVPIQEPDYVRPIAFTFGEESRVLNAELVRTKPSTMSVSLEPSANSVIVRPDVFNGGDSLTFQVLTAGGETVAVSGRVVGINKIREQSGDLRSLFDIGVTFGVPTLLSLLAGLVLSAVGVPVVGPDASYILFFIWFIILVPTFLLVARDSNRWWFYP